MDQDSDTCNGIHCVVIVTIDFIGPDQPARQPGGAGMTKRLAGRLPREAPDPLRQGPGIRPVKCQVAGWYHTTPGDGYRDQG
jgi:hypothetical protein